MGVIGISYLYVCEPGAVMGIEGGYFTVKAKDGCITRIPRETLEAVALFGNVTMTIACTRECLIKGIPVSYFSMSGAYFGRLHSTNNTNIIRQKKQIALSEDKEFRLEFTKKVIKAKIHNQIVMLRRYTRNSPVDLSEIILSMQRYEQKIPNCNSIEQTMGYEGAASRYYFSGLSKLVPKEFQFSGRSRRPPKDAFNSMLSLGYTLLMYEIYGEVENNGLNVYAGFMHADQEKHPTLASDLMEEWRATLIDSTIMSLVVGREVSIQSFWREEGKPGIFLDKKGLRIFLDKYEKKMRQDTQYLSEIEGRISYRRAIWEQVHSLVTVVEKRDLSLYHPIIIR